MGLDQDIIPVTRRGTSMRTIGSSSSPMEIISNKQSMPINISTGMMCCRFLHPRYHKKHRVPSVSPIQSPREWRNVAISSVFLVSFDICTPPTMPTRCPRKRRGGRNVLSAGTRSIFRRLDPLGGILDKKVLLHARVTMWYYVW